MGWVASQRVGDTGIGYTLEKPAGASPLTRTVHPTTRASSSSRLEELEGATTSLPRRPTGLDHRSPDQQIYVKHGYHATEKGRRQLFATVYGTHATPGGFSLDVGDVDTWLTRNGGRLAVWSNTELRQSLQAKHSSTFWVKASSRFLTDGSEEFAFESVRYTRAPIVSAFVPLDAHRRHHGGPHVLRTVGWSAEGQGLPMEGDLQILRRPVSRASGVRALSLSAHDADQVLSNRLAKLNWHGVANLCVLRNLPRPVTDRRVARPCLPPVVRLPAN